MGEGKTLTVSQLTNLIKVLLEDSFKTVTLEGEISNFKRNTNGHLYFQLKDNYSQISAVMFRGSASKLKFEPKDGMKVIAQGQITVYEPRGNYQILITSMTPAGVGNIMEMLEQRKQKLYQEGLFDSSRKKPLPRFPRTVGIVTSSTGAALRDIMNIAKSRNNSVNLIVLSAQVQGLDASRTIISQIEAANTWSLCDVLIVGRGGGSLEDLLPFSDEGVVRAIAASTIPIVSAVGHEIDWALSDFAADVRASTPSHAAEIVIPQKQNIRDSLHQIESDLYTAVSARTQNLRLMLKTFTPQNMELQFRSIEQKLSLRYDTAREELINGIKQRISDSRTYIKHCTDILESASPQSIFNRGYSMVTDAQTGKVIRNAEDTAAGLSIVIRPAQGSIHASVTKTQKAGT